MEIDLHGFELADAMVEIYYALETAKELGDRELTIIHGYSHGSVLKNYIRSKRFLSEVKREGFTLIPKKAPNQGISCFTIAF